MLRRVPPSCTRFVSCRHRYRRKRQATTITDDDTGCCATTRSPSKRGKNCRCLRPHLHHPYYCSVGAPRGSHRSKSTLLQRDTEAPSAYTEQFLTRRLAYHIYYRYPNVVDSDHIATSTRLGYCSCWHCRSSCFTADARRAARCYTADVAASAADADGTTFEADLRRG